MKLEDFNFQLPQDLIASYPLEKRSHSKLLVVKENFKDMIFQDLPDLLKPNDILVINDTAVIKARLFGKKETGSKLEILIERLIDERQSFVQIKSNSKLREGDRIFISSREILLTLIEKKKDVWFVKFSKPVRQILDSYGQVPLPPYIKRETISLDLSRYQTVYADPLKNFSVAAPTAGMHFDEKLLNLIVSKGVNIAKITLHVGMGTFRPIKDKTIKGHKMHEESIEITKKAVQQINKAKKKGGRIICVGTTSLRCLESVCKENSGTLRPFKGETDLFIYPGFKFRLVDILITNFHLPHSTLLLLVSAFAGYEKIRSAYNHAIRKKYRFYSYGDAMFINTRLH